MDLISYTAISTSFHKCTKKVCDFFMAPLQEELGIKPKLSVEKLKLLENLSFDSVGTRNAEILTHEP